MNLQTVKIQLDEQREITLETGKLARQADGSVLLRMGKTVMLATVVSNKEVREGTDFLPLSVDYQEKYSSTGRFPGGFLKREGRLSEYEILIARMIDRTLRPMFPSDFHAEIQVMVTLYSSDKQNMPDSLAGLAASAAVMLTDIPFNGPISKVRVARVDNQIIINPTFEELEMSDYELIVAGSESAVNMVEGDMNECSEEELLEAIEKAHEAIKVQCEGQRKLVELCGRKEVLEYSHEPEPNLELELSIKEQFKDKIYQIVSNATQKNERKEAYDYLLSEYLDSYDEELDDEKVFLIKKYFHDLHKDVVRDMILNENKRLDGRTTTQIRPIWSEVDLLPATHGSALFTRGETQAITSVTLGGKMDTQIIDGALVKGDNKFMLHYNFPSFSVGEARPNRAPGRREIGHGNLALRALKKVLPSELSYTIRIISDILESNGSSSMATVCAGCLGLMDAGIQISAPVSGIAMGLILDPDTRKYVVLSDILGDEDHLGDMDFKVTGTEKGITACQMDIKVEGLSSEILHEALMQAKQGRLHILGEMKKTIENPNQDLKPHAPRIEKFKIEKSFIGNVIGQGGKVIQQIQAETNSTITISEDENNGIVEIMTNNLEDLQKAKEWVVGLSSEPEVGKIYTSTVKNITDFGAFVEFLPGHEGLLHISEITRKRLKTLEGILKVGDKLTVKLIKYDSKTKKASLSRKVLLEKQKS